MGREIKWHLCWDWGYYAITAWLCWNVRSQALHVRKCVRQCLKISISGVYSCITRRAVCSGLCSWLKHGLAGLACLLRTCSAWLLSVNHMAKSHEAKRLFVIQRDHTPCRCSSVQPQRHIEKDLWALDTCVWVCVSVQCVFSFFSTFFLWLWLWSMIVTFVFH